MEYFDEIHYEILKGYVEEIVFRNVDNGYCVVYINADGVLETAVGIFPPIEEGEYLEMKGNYSVNSKFGEQFNVKECRIAKPEDKDAIMRYLASGLFAGVGEVTAKNIFDVFGTATLVVIESAPNKLVGVKGVSL